MIVISSSLPKSGSTLVAGLQEGLLEMCEPRNGQKRLCAAFGGRFIEELSVGVAVRVLYIHWRWGSVVIKTHAPATWVVRWLIRMGAARATYCFRDPRDVILSAVDHCRRDRGKEGGRQPFGEYGTVAEALPRVRKLVGRWRTWRRFGRAYFVRYEEMMGDKAGCVRAMAAYLGWRVTEGQIAELLSRHEPEAGVTHNFNKGTVYRFKTEMGREEAAVCTGALREMIVAEGYMTNSEW